MWIAIKFAQLIVPIDLCVRCVYVAIAGDDLCSMVDTDEHIVGHGFA